MAIPKAAKRASRKADRIHEEVYGTKDKPTEVKTKVETSAPVAQVENPPANTETTVETTVSPEKTKVETTEKPVESGNETTTAPTEPAPVTAVDPDDGSWQHKYKVLQGMYNAEVPRMTKEIRELKAEMEQLKTAPPAAPATPATESLISEKEKDEYGADLIDLVRRAAREEFLPEIQRLEQENASLKGTVGTITETASDSARAHLYTALTEQIPNWQQINSDQKFIMWLQDLDIYSGQTRNTMLQQAFESNDAARVLAFFKGYLNEATATTAPSTPAPATAEPAKTMPVDSLVAPGSPKSTGGTVPASQGNTQIWTQAQISAFYRDVQKGAFKGRESEKAKIERDIIAAVSERRISA